MNAAVHRSTFVNVVAWIFIALSGMGVLMSLAQNLMIHTVFDAAQMEQAMRTPNANVPPFILAALSNFKWFFAAVLIANAITLVISIGLLRRWNWARLAFVGLMVFGIVWNLATLVFQYLMLSFVRENFAQYPDAPDMTGFFVGFGIICVGFALVFSGVFAWLAKRLLSAPIAAEFK